MSRGLQVALIGLKSNFGRVASLLLKQSPAIKNLELYDDVDASTAVDVACIATDCKVRAYQGKEHLHSALKDSNIIIIGDDGQQPADNSKEASDKLLASRIPKIMEYTKAMAEVAPNALVVVAASPMNSIVPIVAQGLAAEGCLDPNKILGCTAADSAKASTLLARALSMDPAGVLLPVIGGSSPNTRVPIFSQAKPKLDFNLDNTEKFGIMKNSKKENERGFEMLDKTYVPIYLFYSPAAAFNNNAENSVKKSFFEREEPEQCLIPRNLSFPLTLMRSPYKPTSPLPSVKLCKTCPLPNLSLPDKNHSSRPSVIPSTKKHYILKSARQQLGLSSIKHILSLKLCSIFNPQNISVVYNSNDKPVCPPKPPAPYLCPTCPPPTCPPIKCPVPVPPPCCHPPKPPPPCKPPCPPFKRKLPKKECPD